MKFKLDIRFLEQEIEVSGPDNTTLDQLLANLLEQEYLPVQDISGNNHEYQFYHASSKQQLSLDKTLKENEVGDNDTILILPRLSGVS